MCDALGFKGSVVGSGKVDNWSFRWNDVTPTGNGKNDALGPYRVLVLEYLGIRVLE